MAPLVVLVGALVFFAYERERDRLDSVSLTTARTLVRTIEASLSVNQAALQALATSPRIDEGMANGDFSALQRQAEEVLYQGSGRALFMADPSGHALFNTMRPYGTALREVDNLPQFNRIQSGGSIDDVALFFGRYSQETLLSVGVPVIRGGQVAFVLFVSIPPASISETLAHGLPPQWVASAIDAGGRVIARSALSNQFVGSVVPQAVSERIAGRAESTYTGRSLEGVALQGAFTTSQRFGFRVALGVPERVLLADTQRVLAWLIGGALAMFLMALALAQRIARRITQPLAGLSTQALALGQGQSVVLRPSGMREVDEVGDALAKARAIICQRETERDQAANDQQRLLFEKQAAEHAHSAKAMFLASMSHELRTPLNAIIGFSELLKDGLVGELTPPQQKHVGTILTSGEHLLALINDVLDLSKVEAGQMQLDRMPTDLGALLRDCLTMIRQEAFKHRVQLDLHLPETLPLVPVDPRKLKQILYNLLSNAVKFSGDDGAIRLAVREVTGAPAELVADGLVFGEGAAQRVFALQDGLPGRFVEISVCDSGIGMSHDDLLRLFQPFTQIDSRLSREFAGTGLGLVMVKNLVELHSGMLAVESATGHGSCFRIWLPMPPAVDAAAAAGNLEAVVPGASMALLADDAGVALPATADAPPAALLPALPVRAALVLEDDPRAAELVRFHLEAIGLQVLRFSSAEAALAALAAGDLPAFELVSVDILLPGMNGLEFLRQAAPHIAGVPVLVLSIKAELAENMAPGAVRVLQKPVSRELLLDALADLGLRGAPDRQPPKVLIVDDDPLAVELQALHLLQSSEYQIFRASNGEEALRLALQEAPSLLILDLLMPGMSGFDVVHALRCNARTTQTPILVCTGRVLSAEERRYFEAHHVSVMQKAQFSPEALLTEVQRLLASPAADTAGG